MFKGKQHWCTTCPVWPNSSVCEWHSGSTDSMLLRHHRAKQGLSGPVHSNCIVWKRLKQRCWTTWTIFAHHHSPSSFSIFPSPVSLWGVSECKSIGEVEEFRFSIGTRRGLNTPSDASRSYSRTCCSFPAQTKAASVAGLWPRSNLMGKCLVLGCQSCKLIRC